MPQQFATGVALVLVAVLLWGAQLPIAKGAFAAVDPYHVSVIRYGVATLLLAPIVAWREGPASFRYYGRVWPVSLLGVIGMTCSPLLVFAGLAVTRPEHAVMIVSLQPSLAAIADWLLRGRRPDRFTRACIVTAFVGVVLVVTKGNPALAIGRGELLGDLLVLAGAACWVFYTIGTESFRGWPVLKLTTLTLIPGSIGLVVATAALVPLGIARVPTWGEIGSVGGELALLALGGVLAGMICWNAGTKRIGALNSMLMLNLMPVVVFAIEFAQGQRFEPVELVGAGLVIGALAANNLYLRRVHAPR